MNTGMLTGQRVAIEGPANDTGAYNMHRDAHRRHGQIGTVVMWGAVAGCFAIVAFEDGTYDSVGIDLLRDANH